MFKIIDSVYSRLVDLRDECVGALYGIMSQNTLVITSLSIETPGENGLESFDDMQLHFPTGIDYCGVFSCRTTTSEGESIVDIIKEVQITDNPLFLEKDANGEMTAMVLRDGRLTETCLKIISEKEFLELFVFLRLRGRIPLTCSKLQNSPYIDESQKTLSEDCIFHFTGTDIYICNDNEQSLSKLCLKDVMKKAPHSTDLRLNKGLLEVQLLVSVSSFGEKQLSSFKILPDSKNDKIIVHSSIDAICIAEYSRLTDNLYGLLTDTFCRHVQLVEKTMNMYKNNLDKLCELQEYHFYVAPQFVTLMSLRNNDDGKSKGMREELHRQLALPRDRPYFRRGNRLVISPSNEKSILFNVHEGLIPSVKGGKQAIVHGLYSYHHYMQDGINDDGWGCAYRSLQTLFSWYKYHGYTDANIPSHKDIQTCLVDLGDKEKKFIGSKEWIGSAEVGYCLNTWLGVTTYTLTYASGTALKSSGPDLIKHFELHGTPIMIGGGQLAHTILGVDFNEETEEIKFLILDPHYTGSEDLKTIQGKGWVGWKPLEFWKKNSFYNMCLPSKPRVL